MQIKTVTLAAAIFGSLTASPAAAQNLVTNPGFETGDFTGWTQGGNTGFTSVGTGGYAHSGTYGAQLGPVGSNGSLSQTLSTTFGQNYDVGFWHFFPGSTPSYFGVTWDGVDLFPPMVNATTPTSYTQYTYPVVGTGSDTLSFIFRNDPSYQGLDDISVTAASDIGGVPEPATWAMLLLGFGAVGVAMRRRKRDTRVKYSFG